MATSIKDIRALAELMREFKLSRLSANGVELEASSFDSAPQALDGPTKVDLPDEELCSCGHSIPVCHSPDGCFEGCSVALCETLHEKEPEA